MAGEQPQAAPPPEAQGGQPQNEGDQNQQAGAQPADANQGQGQAPAQEPQRVRVAPGANVNPLAALNQNRQQNPGQDQARPVRRADAPREIDWDQVEGQGADVHIPGEEANEVAYTPRTRIGEITSEEINARMPVSKAKYEKAIEIQNTARGESLRRIYEKVKGPAKFALAAGALSLGTTMLGGYGLSESWGMLRDSVAKPAINLVTNTVGGFINRIDNWGKGVSKGIFDYSRKGWREGGIFQQLVGGFARLTEMAGSGIDPDKFSMGATKAVGTPLVNVFGRGVLQKKYDYRYPDAGTEAGTALGLLGLVTGGLAVRKAAQLLDKNNRAVFAVGSVKRQEKKMLDEQIKEARKRGDYEEVAKLRQTKNYVDPRVKHYKKTA